MKFIYLSIIVLVMLLAPCLAENTTTILEPIVSINAEEMILQAPGFEKQMTTDSVLDWNPRIDGNYLAWVQFDKEGKIWYYDIKSGRQDMVSNIMCDQNDPDISDGIIVWDDNRQKGYYNIYSYNIPMHKEFPVYVSSSNKFKPAISHDMVVFEDYGNDDTRDIRLVKIGTSSEPAFINRNDLDKANPDIDGKWVVYQQLDDGKSDWNIYLYNYETKETRQVTRNPATQQNPRISGNYIVWEDNRSGKWDVFMYNIEKDITTAVTYDDNDDLDPAVSGSKIVWARFDANKNSDIYMVDLQIPKTYAVCAGPGNQINPDISVDRVVWQDDRFGGSDVFLYTLQPNTPYRPFQFYGPVTLDNIPAPVGTEIIAKIGRETKDSIKTKEVGYYGGAGSQADQLTVEINQADIGKQITFYSGGVQGSRSIPVKGDGSSMELPLGFAFQPSLPELQFYGYVAINGQPAVKGTVIKAIIDGVVRGSYQLIQDGKYGGQNPQDAGLVVPINNADLGKHISFTLGDCPSDQVFQITSGGRFRQDLTSTTAPSIPPYEFYGYIQIGGKPAPAGTTIEAKIDSKTVTSYVTKYAGSYGSPGNNPEDRRLVVPVNEADAGRIITFWNGPLKADTSQVITRGGERIIRKDLNMGLSPIPQPPQPQPVTPQPPQPSQPGINADFTALPQSGNSPLTVQFKDLSTGGPTMWSWDFGDGVKEGMLANPIHTYTKGGSYTITLSASNQYGSSDIETKYGYITVGSVPPSGINADFTASPRSGSSPLTVQFKDLSTGGPTMWSWDFGDGVKEGMLANPIHTYTKEGSYTVTLSASNQYGSSDIETKPGYISVSNSPGPVDSITVYPGWNYISVPKKLAQGKDTASIFSNINVDGHSIFQYNAITGQWIVMNPSSPVKPLDAIWIYSRAADKIPLTYSSDPLQTPPTKELRKGWNAVGFTGLSPVGAKFTFLSVQDKWVNCLGFNEEKQQYDDMIIKGRNDEVLLYPFSGYWLFMSDNGTLAAISA